MSLGIAGIELSLPGATVRCIKDFRRDPARPCATRTDALPSSFVVAVLLIVRAPLLPTSRKKLPASCWLPVATAVLIMLAVAILTRDPGPDAGGVISTLTRFCSSSSLSPNQVSLGIASNMVAFTVHWVLAMGFAVPWMVLRWRRS
jgi:hypothetical protein